VARANGVLGHLDVVLRYGEATISSGIE